ncbi:acyl-CoA dehydrogenase family protein [Sphingomonas sp. 67-41]|jgi:butyryl-CoA dehydrogenase|uniref:acyl-CoA dehydrogenase family protein n=1 Tax=Sphingomonas TaxID=13687 RepID=UPI000961B22B|nr:acyl-CoA dehydrogenase family protein [Sphingomonas sp. 67-41]OJY53899.1 MAG: butyryl-CoA dehydrogenase [Sphingomonas sp. 67-41]
MDFQLSDDQRELQETARKFARAELMDLSREMEEKAMPLPEAMRKRYAEMGFLGINLPEQYGGLGLGHLEALLVLEQFAMISPAVAWPIFESATGPVRTVQHFASDTLKDRILPEVIQGDKIVAVSMSEPSAGTALTDLKTAARYDGDEIVLTGQKRWCSGGGHSDYYIVYCRFDGEPGAKGIGAVLVEKEREGLSFGRPEQLMGFRGIPSADIFLDDVRVPRDNIIVPKGGFAKLMTAFSLERCGNATMGLGIAAAALEEATAYAQERTQFSKPIVDFQAIQMKLAEMAMKVEASRLLIYRAAVNASQGLPSILDSSIAKCFSNEMVVEVASTGLQIMGGYGYSKEYRMEQRVRDSYAWGIAGGTTDVQKTNIASALVGRRFNQRA